MIIRKLFTLFLGAAFCTSINAQKSKEYYTSISQGDKEIQIISKAAHLIPSTRQFRWQQLELTAFFHFGINTFTNREWGLGNEDPALFNPTKLDANQWVRVAKEAGFKQVILTTKHHDGFCLWPTNTTNYSVKNSPWKKGNGDVVREVADACKKQNMGFGIYLSPWDRNSTLYGTDDYNNFFVNQLTELLTNYGRIDEVWFDGANGEGANGKKQRYDFKHWYEVIRKLQPTAVIAVMGPDVRWVGTETGYGRETEWSVVPINNLDQVSIASNSQQEATYNPQGDMTGNELGSRDKIINAKGLVWYPAETDVSIRPGWFYHKDENDKVKTPEKLLDIYFHSVGRNSVLLMNIPPDKEGLINDADIKNLRRWKKLRDSIFNNNLSKGAIITSDNGIHPQALIDQNYTTYWTTKGKDTTAVIQLNFKNKKTINILMLQENILVGQRIEKFRLEYFNGKEWLIATEGTTVGYKRLLQFDAIATNKVRLKILSSRSNPTLSEIGLYYKQIRSQ